MTGSWVIALMGSAALNATDMPNEPKLKNHEMCCFEVVIHRSQQ
jgi:hypothetical protein